MEFAYRLSKSRRCRWFGVLVALMAPILLLYVQPSDNLVTAMGTAGDPGQEHKESRPAVRRHVIRHRDKVRDATTFTGHSQQAKELYRTSSLDDNKSFFLSQSAGSGVNVVLNARYRTGSSFTGEFFNRNEEFVYYFEPFHDTKNGTFVNSSSTVTHILQGLFDCTLRADDLRGTRPTSNWKYVVMCGLGQTCNNPIARRYSYTKAWDSRFQDVCKSRQHHAVKVIRVATISSLVPLMRRGVKVIHLVRDPRGTYTSRRRIILGTDNRTDDIKRYCDIVLNDLDTIRDLYRRYNQDLLKALYVVRYEDIATRPLWYLHDIYKFLGVDPTDDVIDWAQDLQERNREGKGSPRRRFKARDIISTVREDPADTAFAWRKKIIYKDLIAIQRVCRRFFDEFGYNIFKTRTERSEPTVPAMFEIADLFANRTKIIYPNVS